MDKIYDFNTASDLSFLNSQQIMILPHFGNSGTLVAEIIFHKHLASFICGSLDALGVTFDNLPSIDNPSQLGITKAKDDEWRRAESPMASITNQEAAYILNQSAIKRLIEKGVTNILNFDNTCEALDIEPPKQKEWRKR